MRMRDPAPANWAAVSPSGTATRISRQRSDGHYHQDKQCGSSNVAIVILSHPQVRSYRLFTLPISDPVTALHIGSHALSFGTILGRVCGFVFDYPLTAGRQGGGSDSLRNQLIKGGLTGTLSLYTAFSEDSIHMTYSTADRIFAIVGNSYCLDWPLHRPARNPREEAVKFDRRISASVKYVLPHKTRALIASLGVTIVYDVVTAVQLLCPLRLPDVDVVPLAFSDDRMLAFIHSMEDIGPTLKVLRLPTSMDEPSWGVAVECIFHQDLPGVTGIACAKFWGDDCFACVANGRHICVFSISSGKEIHHWTGHRYDVCAMEASRSESLITISEDSNLRIWSRIADGCVYSMSLEPSRFSLGNPYHVALWDRVLVYSCDEEIAAVVLPEEF